LTGELSAADVARLRGVHRTTASRWLRQLHEQHGPLIVSRRGNHYVTSHEALAKIGPGLSRETETRRELRALNDRIEMSEKRTDALVREVTSLSRELKAFRELARSWFLTGKKKDGSAA